MEPGSDNEDTMAHSNAAYSLLLPGKILNLRALSVQKKFRGSRGNKEGAKRGWYLLQKSGLGEVKNFKARRGTDMVSTSTHSLPPHYLVLLHQNHPFQLYEFHKKEIPIEETSFVEALMPFGISLQQYKSSMAMEDITM